jgi:23S rRNA pseudouridine2605 synthase
MEYPSPLLMLNKPKGYVVSRADEHGRKTVYSLLPPWAFEEEWMPVGRLDLDS